MSAQETNDSGKHIHYQAGVPVLETQLERIEREQTEARDRDRLYKDEQLEINRQQLTVNKRLMIFTFLLVVTSAITSGISLYQANISKASADAAKSAAETASKTLKEMQTGQGATDTHTLAQEAVTQATQTTNLAAAADAQAKELRDSIQQASRLAKATEDANSNVLNADRPWIGASFAIQDFEVGKTPNYTVTFINSGKRPAKVTLTETLTIEADLGSNPIYKPFDTTPSTSFLVPGQNTASRWADAGIMSPISKEVMEQIRSGAIPVRVYAKIEYEDVQTGAHYWTHACWRYGTNQLSYAQGFINCSEYNEAK